MIDKYASPKKTVGAFALLKSLRTATVLLVSVRVRASVRVHVRAFGGGEGAGAPSRLSARMVSRAQRGPWPGAAHRARARRPGPRVEGHRDLAVTGPCCSSSERLRVWTGLRLASSLRGTSMIVLRSVQRQWPVTAPARLRVALATHRPFGVRFKFPRRGIWLTDPRGCFGPSVVA